MFQLDPQHLAARFRSSPGSGSIPTLAASIWRGIIGFTVVSIAGFLPWPIFDRWFQGMREMDLYLACTAIFVGLSGVCLHRLILGPGSLWRFYALFSIAFVVYAVAWVGMWITLRGDAGSLAGLLAGTAAMGGILAFAFRAPRAAIPSILALFVLNTIGYYLGGWIEGKLIIEHRLVAMLLWGACYGIGFGAGLGAAFYFCQAPARALLRTNDSTVPQAS